MPSGMYAPILWITKKCSEYIAKNILESVFIMCFSTKLEKTIIEKKKMQKSIVIGDV